MRIPPGVSASTYSEALRKFAAVIGAENVYTSDEDLDLYRDGYSVLWGEPEERIAAGALAPIKVEEIQAIVRIANQYKIPLYPVSTGRNLGYGGSAPNLSGSVVLDLKRMDRVLELNEELNYCIVEPGVSFFNLYAELRRRNSRLRCSMPAPGWGSPMGNALDHGRGNPASDQFRNACGLEVVLGTGELVRTGMGALPNCKTWATYNNGVGPSLDGIFSQSNFGIVTKMGFNLHPWPETTRHLVIATRNFDDLDGMVATCRQLQAAGVGSGSGFGSPLHSVLARNPVPLYKTADGTAARFNQLAAEHDTDLFRCQLTFTGPDKVTQAQLEVALERVKANNASLKLTTPPAIFAPDDISKLTDDQASVFGKPSLVNFWSDTAQYDWDGHLWFSPLLPQTGAELRKIQQTLGEVCDDMNLFWGWPPALLYNSAQFGAVASNFCIVKNFDVSKSDHEHNRRTRDTVAKLIRVAADNGWSEYRGAPALQEAIMDTFSFNNHAFMRLCESLKDAVDPNGILSSGRYGIWPKHLRKNRT
jgi:(+)-pinoresinol hydroxylase